MTSLRWPAAICAVICVSIAGVSACGPASSQPLVVGRFPGGSVEHIAIAGTTLFFTDTLRHEPPLSIDHNSARVVKAATLRIVDATDPAQPKERGRLSVPDYLGAMAAHGSVLLVEVGIQFKGLRPEPESPDQQWISKGWLRVEDSSYSEGVFTGVSNLLALDVTDPASPQLLGVLNLTPSDTLPSKVSRIVLDGDGRAFLKLSQLDTIIVDVSDPRQLRRLGTVERGLDIALAGSHLHMADGAGVTVTDSDGRKDFPGGFAIVDVSNPAEPRELGRLDSAALGRDGFGANADQVAVRDSHAYLGQSILRGLRVDSSLAVLDVSDPRNPKEVRRIALSDDVTTLAIRGSLLYMTQSSEAIAVYDLTDPSSPRESRRLSLKPLGGVLQTLVGERHVYVGSFDGLSIVGLPQ